MKLLLVIALLASLVVLLQAKPAEEHQCHICRKLIGAIRSGPYAYKTSLSVLERLKLDTERACTILATRGNTPNFIACKNITQLATIIAANVTANTTSICHTQDASLCNGFHDADACGGPCSSPQQCGPGCYCDGYGTCDDACAPACQGETQFCPSGCGCGDYGFCDAD